MGYGQIYSSRSSVVNIAEGGNREETQDSRRKKYACWESFYLLHHVTEPSVHNTQFTTMLVASYRFSLPFLVVVQTVNYSAVSQVMTRYYFDDFSHNWPPPFLAAGGLIIIVFRRFFRQLSLITATYSYRFRDTTPSIVINENNGRRILTSCRANKENGPQALSWHNFKTESSRRRVFIVGVPIT